VTTIYIKEDGDYGKSAMNRVLALLLAFMHMPFTALAGGGSPLGDSGYTHHSRKRIFKDAVFVKQAAPTEEE